MAMPSYDELYLRGQALLLLIKSELDKISKENIRTSPDLSARTEDFKEMCVALAMQEWIWNQGIEWNRAKEQTSPSTISNQVNPVEVQRWYIDQLNKRLDYERMLVQRGYPYDTNEITKTEQLIEEGILKLERLQNEKLDGR